MIKRLPHASTVVPHPPQYPPPLRTPAFGWLLLKNKKPRPSKAWSPSLSIFSMGCLFVPNVLRPKQPPLCDLQRIADTCHRP